MKTVDIEINNKIINIKVIYKDVKRIRLVIYKEDYIVLTANPLINDQFLMDFVKKQKHWIEKKLNSLYIIKSSLQIEDKKVLLFGKTYKIERTKNNDKLYKTNNDVIYIPFVINEESINIEIRKKYYELIKPLFNSCYKEFLTKYPNIAVEVKFRETKKRYGTCYYKKNVIILSKNLVHYSIEQIKYVIYHELSHLIVPNHSSKFYRVLKDFVSKHKQIKKEMFHMNMMINN